MWMIETGQKVKQVRGVLHCILQVSIPRLINQHLTKVCGKMMHAITFSHSSCVTNQYLGNSGSLSVKAFIL